MKRSQAWSTDSMTALEPISVQDILKKSLSSRDAKTIVYRGYIVETTAHFEDDVAKEVEFWLSIAFEHIGGSLQDIRATNQEFLDLINVRSRDLAVELYNKHDQWWSLPSHTPDTEGLYGSVLSELIHFNNGLRISPFNRNLIAASRNYNLNFSGFQKFTKRPALFLANTNEGLADFTNVFAKTSSLDPEACFKFVFDYRNDLAHSASVMDLPDLVLYEERLDEMYSVLDLVKTYYLEQFVSLLLSSSPVTHELFVRGGQYVKGTEPWIDFDADIPVRTFVNIFSGKSHILLSKGNNISLFKLPDASELASGSSSDQVELHDDGNVSLLVKSEIRPTSSLEEAIKSRECQVRLLESSSAHRLIEAHKRSHRQQM